MAGEARLMVANPPSPFGDDLTELLAPVSFIRRGVAASGDV